MSLLTIGSFRLATAVLMAAVTAVSSQAADASLKLRFDNLSVPAAESNHWLQLNITNLNDHIAGLELVLELSRPDLAVFAGDFDTTGSVVGGWEYLQANVEDGGRRLHLWGLAESFPPYNHLPIFPSATERRLMRVSLRVLPISDTVTARTAAVQINDSLQNFGWATDQGELIGLLADTTIDTLLYVCVRSDDTGCVVWQQVNTPPYDRMVIDTTLYPYLDTSYFDLPPGLITVLPNCTPIQSPGDVNLDGVASEADYAALQLYINGGGPPASTHNGDLNGDSCINVSDLAILSRYLEYGPDSVTIADCAIYGPTRCCCVGTRGNVTADAQDLVDLSDLSFLVNYLTAGGILPCPKEADWNASGLTDLTDLSALVAYLTGAGGTAQSCP